MGDVVKVELLDVLGFKPAMLGVGFSHGLTSDLPLGADLDDYPDLHKKLSRIADKLALKGGGESKFLESIQVHLDVLGPRYWWQEFDTYRVGMSKQSESTMHTITKSVLTQRDFVEPIMELTLDYLNETIAAWKTATMPERKEELFRKIKRNLPEGFLQRRVVSTNYMVLQHMHWKRHDHRLAEWREFFSQLLPFLPKSEWVMKV